MCLSCLHQQRQWRTQHYSYTFLGRNPSCQYCLRFNLLSLHLFNPYEGLRNKCMETGGKCFKNWPHRLKAELSCSLLQLIISKQIKNIFQSRKVKKEQEARLELTHSDAASCITHLGASAHMVHQLNSCFITDRLRFLFQVSDNIIERFHAEMYFSKKN